MSEVSLRSEVWNGKWGVSLWLLYKLNNVKRVIAWQERIELVKVQCPNITELVVCVVYLWLSQRFRIKAKQNKTKIVADGKKNLCTWADPEQNVLPFQFWTLFHLVILLFWWNIVPNKLIKLATEQLSAPFTEIYNESIISGKFPEIFKISKVTPIFKSGSLSELGDYRLIAVVSPFSPIWKKNVYYLTSNLAFERDIPLNMPF